LTLPQTPNVEAVGTTIKLKNNKSIDIISVYCPDGNANTKQDITDILNTLTNSYVIGGDLNAHSTVWEDDHQQNRCGKQIAEILLDDERITLCTPKNLGTRPNPNGKESSTIDLTFS
jgi:hypothetical protein